MSDTLLANFLLGMLVWLGAALIAAGLWYCIVGDREDHKP